MGAGHAGTSISVAIGIAEAYRRKGDPHKVIAIIGDAALTSGMAYEALHQSIEFKRNLIVILNDNEMSISPCLVINLENSRTWLWRCLRFDKGSSLANLPAVSSS